MLNDLDRRRRTARSPWPSQTRSPPPRRDSGAARAQVVCWAVCGAHDFTPCKTLEARQVGLLSGYVLEDSASGAQRREALERVCVLVSAFQSLTIDPCYSPTGLFLNADFFLRFLPEFGPYFRSSLEWQLPEWNKARAGSNT